MANCKACDDLRTNAPSVLVNGIDETACTSLKNDTGLNPSTSMNDCADLEDLNDCLVGNMADEIDAYDVCDWKDYMKKFVPNVYTVLAAIICAICGLWTNISSLWKKVNYLLCVVENLSKNQNWRVGEDYIHFAPGVSKTAGLVEPRITGNAFAGYLTGSITISDAWLEAHKNSDLNDGGAMLYEYRIPKSLMEQYGISYIWPGQAQENGAGNGIHAHINVFHSGDDLWGYDDNKAAHYRGKVPEGACYIQLRMTSYQGSGVGSTGNTTLAGVMPVLLDTSELGCKE